jgi:hypothetical protein
MKQIVLILLSISLFSACKKSEDPTPSNSNNTTINTPPTLQANLSYNATTSIALQIDLSSKITDANGDTWSITNSTALHGTTSISNTAISYTSNTAYTGNDTITITMQDSKGASSTGKIAITVSASTPTNTPPVVNSSTNITFYSIQWLGNVYGYSISIKSRPQTYTFDVTDADNDNVAITSVTGYSSNIQEIRGVATNISSDDIANGNFNGDIQIIPNNRVYAGTETFTITFSDGKSTVTKTFTIQFGSESQIEAYNILSYFFDKPLDGHIYCDCGHGHYTILSAGTITTTATQPSGDFFEWVVSEGTYNYTISSGGYITFTISSAASITYNPPQLTTIDGVKYLTLTKTNTSNCAFYGNCAYTFWLN